MDKESIKKYFLDFAQRDFSNILPREIELKESKKIVSLIGSRRVGKTYLFLKKIRELESKGVSREQIIYLNFENPVLNECTYTDFKLLLELYWQIFPRSMGKQIFFFIDEPQVIDKWEIGVRGLYDEFGFPIFITGSSSKLLSKEIATSLRGRTITLSLFPLSFKEFLMFKNTKLDFDKLSTKDKAKLMSCLDEFLKYGSYPEIVLEEDINQKHNILKTYLDLIIYKDIVERFKVKNTSLIKSFINQMIKSAGKEISLNKLYLDYKSRGLKISKNTLYEYFSMLEDSFFISGIRKYAFNLKNEEKSFPKVYLNNIGFYNFYSSEDYGKRLENAVYLHLASKINNAPLMRINYWKGQNNKEVDFIVFKADKIKMAIQVCYSFSDKYTKDREISAMVSCLNSLNLNKGIIITLDEEEEIKKSSFVLKVIPFWKFIAAREILETAEGIF